MRNALVQHVRRDVLPAAWRGARTLVRDAEAGPATALGLSGYDAEFAALADALDVLLVPDDRRVLAACPNGAVSLDAFGAENAVPDETGR